MIQTSLANFPRIVQTVIPASRTSPQIITSISKGFTGFKSALSNTGVKIGLGLGATGAGLGILNHQAEQVTNPLGIQGSSSLLVIGIIIVILLVVLKK